MRTAATARLATQMDVAYTKNGRTKSVAGIPPCNSLGTAQRQQTIQIICHGHRTAQGVLRQECAVHFAGDRHTQRHQHRASMESMGMARLLRRAAVRACVLLPSKPGTMSSKLSMAGSSPHNGSVSAELSMTG